MHIACLWRLLLVLYLFLKQTGHCCSSLFSEQSESQWLLVSISKCGADVCYSWVILLPLRFQNCRKLSEDVQNAILAVATVYYWLPKGQGEIMTARQSLLYRMVVLSEFWNQQVFISMVSHYQLFCRLWTCLWVRYLSVCCCSFLSVGEW